MTRPIAALVLLLALSACVATTGGGGCGDSEVAPRVRAAAPGATCESAPFDATTAARLKAGYADTYAQAPAAAARMDRAFATTFADGRFLNFVLPVSRTQVTVLEAPGGGDYVGRALVTPQTWPQDPAAAQAEWERLSRVLAALGGASLPATPEAGVRLFWQGGFRSVGQGGRAIHGWGVPPDFVEMTFTSRTAAACPFRPAKGWLARQTCP